MCDSERPSITASKSQRVAGKAYGRNATMPVLCCDKYAEVNIPHLKEFNPDDIGLDSTIVAIGKRRTGKSWIFRNLMYLLKDKIPAGIVISQTDELNGFWHQYVPSKFIFKEYDPAIIAAVFKRQRKILMDPKLSDEEKEKLAPFFILLDDVISDPRLKNDQHLKELFVAGRHYKVFVLITTQYAKAITPVIRGNTDFVFMLKTIQERQLEALWEDFGSFLTKDAFFQILDIYTDDNECLVFNTSEPSLQENPLDMMSWWKAQDPGPFQIGCDEYWKTAAVSRDVPRVQKHKVSPQTLLGAMDVMPNSFVHAVPDAV